MRPLTEEESKAVFEKLARYVGRNLKYLIDRTDESFVFRLHRERVYYVREALMRRAGNAARKELVAFGTCLGKFTKSRKFMLRVTALDLLAQYAVHKVWVKGAAEMQFLYGGHVSKGGLARITASAPRRQGVVVFNLNEVPLGFGTTAYSTTDCRGVESTAIVCYNQADTGEYLRDEAQII